MYQETHDELYKFSNDLWSTIYNIPNNLKKSFNNLYSFLIKLEPIKLQLFIDTNHYILKTISHELITMIKEANNNNPYHNADSNTLRSMYDKLFIKINVKNNLATFIFKNFIKGITYFQYQENGYIKDPVYHRLFSCGDGKNSFRNKFNICNSTLMNKIELKNVSKKIKTCFLERLIYEKIFLKYMFKLNNKAYYNKNSQDEGHTVWLKQTNNDFNTCFPNINIKIKIKYTDLFPTYLIVVWILNNKIIYIEEYFKFIEINKDGNVSYKNKVLFIKRNSKKTYTTKTNFENKNTSFSKKDEDNKLLFKLLEKDYL
jgi:hypothetical protein